MAQLMPTLFLSHGAGPAFFMETSGSFAEVDSRSKTADFMRKLHTLIPKPKAVLCVSAHWETSKKPAVCTNPKPHIIYDYGGFPPHTYKLEYPANGDVDLAKKVSGLLSNAGIANDQDPTYGFDHGTFIPFKLIFPEADVPIVQLSIVRGYDPKLHLAIGKALEPLRREGVLIVGSGSANHNFQGAGAAAKPWNEWLTETLTTLSPEEREKRLEDIDACPWTRKNHPIIDHLIPLHVVVGASGNAVGQKIHHFISKFDFDLSSFMFSEGS